MLISGEAGDEETIEYIESIIRSAKRLSDNNQMLFWGLNNGRTHLPCPDQSLPKAKMIYELPYNMYMDVLTIINNRVVNRNQASRRYLDVLFEGLKENYTYLDGEEVWDYLNTRD